MGMQYLKVFNYVQTNELWLFKNDIYKLIIYKSYVFNIKWIWH